MNTTWALRRLDELQQAVDHMRSVRKVSATDAEPGARHTAERNVEQLLVIGTAIAEEYFDNWSWGYGRDSSELSRRIQQVRGQVMFADEIAKELTPDAPHLQADRFHRWVWNAARPFWESQHHGEAVGAAARKVNAELQNRLQRRDLSDSKLCGEAFSLKPPDANSARLRVPGDRTSETWRARQEGALAFSRGCYMALRNPLAHDDQEIPEREGLEQLAAFSILSRWIEAADVETADELAGDDAAGNTERRQRPTPERD